MNALILHNHWLISLQNSVSDPCRNNTPSIGLLTESAMGNSVFGYSFCKESKILLIASNSGLYIDQCQCQHCTFIEELHSRTQNNYTRRGSKQIK